MNRSKRKYVGSVQHIDGKNKVKICYKLIYIFLEE
jgi:hypothetical protein